MPTILNADNGVVSGISGLTTTADNSGVLQFQSSGTATLEISTAGNINIPGTGKRITGDFSNATHANRLSFQTSTTNGATTPFFIPNGTGNVAGVVVANASDPTNSSFGQLRVNGTSSVDLISSILGTGTQLPMVFSVGSERMRIDTSGNVGIGTSAGTGRFTVDYTAPSTFTNAGGDFVSMWRASGTNALGVAANTTGSVVRFVTNNGYVLAFNNASTETMRIDSSGNVGIGTSSPSAKLHVAGGADSTIRNTASSGSSWFIGTNTSSYLLHNESNTPMIFTTNGTERMRIDSSGNLLVGTTTAGARVTFAGATTSSGAFALKVSNSAGTLLLGARDDGYVTFPENYNLTTGNAANMWFDASGYPYRSTSSLKYKKNVQDAVHGLSDLMNLRSVTYEGKSEVDVGKTFGGLIAEEVHEAGLTEFVQYADDGTPDALHYGHMVSICIKAIQEQQAIITDLKARIETLESK